MDGREIRRENAEYKVSHSSLLANCVVQKPGNKIVLENNNERSVRSLNLFEIYWFTRPIRTQCIGLGQSFFDDRAQELQSCCNTFIPTCNKRTDKPMGAG
jgi:hypothetical protein